MPAISPLAIVETSAPIPDDVRIGPFSYIGAEVQIGPGCIIDNNVTIVGRTTLGAKNHIFPMAVIGTTEDGSEAGECYIGEANAIREHVTIYAGANKATRIGNDNLIMIASQIGPGAIVGDHGIFDNLTQIGPGSRIEDYVRTGAFSFIDPDVTVGAYTFTVAYVRVNRNAPPFATIQGSPFRVRGVNAENLRRCGFGDDDIRALKNAFRELFNDTNDPCDAEVIRRLKKLAGTNPHVMQLIQSIKPEARQVEAQDNA